MSMKIVVMKFGGTSLANIEKIKNVAKIVINNSKNNKILVVLSAMSGVTNQLQSYIDEVDYVPSEETDLVMTSGEQVTVGLLSMILNKQGVKSKPLLGWQIPIVTDENHEKARILNIENKRIYHHFESYDVIVLTGFQGISLSGQITSLGRGGSDTTAVAIASSLSAERCDIFTDVEGVFTADPNIVSNAKKIDKLAYEEMLEMSSTGAKVLQTRSVELALKNNLTLQVLSSFADVEGTYILNENKLIEKEIVSGVSYSINESKISISGILDKPGISAKIFELMSTNNINVDMIVQNISQDGISANMTFTVPTKDLGFAKKILQNNRAQINYHNLSADSDIAKISVIGMGMMSQTGVAEKMFRTLAEKQVNILAISTSEIKISVLIQRKYCQLAIKSLHSVYKLNKT
jgi:aspartate kinase